VPPTALILTTKTLYLQSQPYFSVSHLFKHFQVLYSWVGSDLSLSGMVDWSGTATCLEKVYPIRQNLHKCYRDHSAFMPLAHWLKALRNAFKALAMLWSRDLHPLSQSVTGPSNVEKRGRCSWAGVRVRGETCCVVLAGIKNLKQTINQWDISCDSFSNKAIEK